VIKLFLSHASEDKDFVRPLAETLRTDFSVWYDEYELTLGDSLLRKINEGLRSCDYGIVVLSHNFFSKQWPQTELDGLFNLEMSDTNGKVILPIWHGLRKPDVEKFSPILAGRLGVSTESGLDNVVREVKRGVGLVDRVKTMEHDAWRQKFAALEADIDHRKKVEVKNQTTEAVEEVRRVARGIIVEGRKRAEELIQSVSSFQIRIKDLRGQTNPESLTLVGPGLISLNISFSALYMNAVDKCRLRFALFRDKDFFDHQAFETLERIELEPHFDRDFQIFWKDDKHTFSSGGAFLDFSFEKFADALKQQFGGSS
jgi:hypothetical protein